MTQAIDELLPLEDDSNSSNSASSVDNFDEDLEDEDWEIEDPAQVRTQHSSITSPFSRLGMVGGVFGVGFLVVYFSLNSVMNGSSEPIIAKTATPPQDNTVESKNSDGDIYAKLALAKQKEELAALGKPPADKVETPPKPVAAPAPTRTVVVRQAVPPAPRPVASPATMPAPRIATAPAPAKDPFAELERLRKIGSIGKIEYGDKYASAHLADRSNSSAGDGDRSLPYLDPARATAAQSEDNVPELKSRESDGNSDFDTDDTSPDAIEQLKPRWQPSLSPTAVKGIASNAGDRPLTVAATPSATLASYDYLPEEAQILSGKQPQYLTIGSHASATLVTPLFLSQQRDDRSSGSKRRFVARLDEPLMANTGEIGIPAGTLVTIAMTSVDSASQVHAEVTAILKDETEYPVPSGAIGISGKNSSPLIARKMQNKGKEMAGFDLTLGAVAGLASIGETMNQPDEEVVDDLPFGDTRTRRTHKRRSMTGAFLQGAFGQLADSIGSRTQKATDEIAQRPDIWYIPQNTKIVVEVDRSLKL
jgi:Bacterial conjugation TrbI-like protein